MSSELPLPDVDSWQPRDASHSLAAVFAAECNGAEERLLRELQHEKRFAVDNFDTGLPFEGLVRRELGHLLPQRYTVTSGLVLDRAGKTAGKCDVVVFNDRWFVPVKSPPTKDAGQSFIPIEGVYAIGEVKQTLSAAALDQAMEKLVSCHRLQRPRTCAHRIVENRDCCSCPHGLTNPLFSFILAGGVAPNESFQSLIERFFDISKKLKRLEVVRALCILGEGTVIWAFRNPLREGEINPALFVEGDLFHPIFPVFSPATLRSSLLFFIQALQLSLFHVVLGPDDLAARYSLDTHGIQWPKSPALRYLPMRSGPSYWKDHAMATKR